MGLKLNRKPFLLLTIAPLAFASAALAEQAPVSPTGPALKVADAAPAAKAAVAEAVFSTGVAKGRDRLDSATSTSALREAQIQRLGARSLADILRNIPGIRVESSTGDGNSSYTIRGLPLASGGSKFMQIQEDGLPVLEFGDFFNIASDIFIHADFNLAAIEAIRGGSASTFSSNSPGGVINLISKTGDIEGGSIQLTTGMGYDTKRLDFDYGAPITPTLRFHIGGFYRTGEGERRVGYNAFQGGQLKFNVTKQVEGGFIRLSAKYLDDRSPQYLSGPVQITGTNENPVYASYPNFDLKRDTVLSKFIPTLNNLDGNNNPTQIPLSQGMNALVRSVGLEAQFTIAGWTVTDRARYSKISGGTTRNLVANIYAGNALPPSLGGNAGTFSYATGPLAGQAIANLNTINGNGLIAATSLNRIGAQSLDNFTNDLRANRAFQVGQGELTVTGGLYKALQDLNSDWLYGNILQDVVGNGNSSLIDYRNPAGVLQSQDGYLGYNRSGNTAFFRRKYDVQYDVTAPYGSINYRFGRIAVGASVRYDIGKVRGQIFGADLGGGRIGIQSFDFNGNGVISPAESRTAFTPLTRPAPVNYNYHYMSYSTGINFRVSEPFAMFARYSHGARANADKVLFSSKVSTIDGSMPNSADGYDIVEQVEGGFKYRNADLTVNVTGFLAKTEDTNVQAGAITTDRRYRAYGVEAEAGYRRGIFSMVGGLTYTKAEILGDALNAAVAGQVPRRQPKLIFQATPQIDIERFSLGANVVGNTSSYTQDINLLKLPGYTLVNAFIQFRPYDRLQVMVNANNLFNTLAIIEVAQTGIPANGVGWGRATNGRTVSASVRADF